MDRRANNRQRPAGEAAGRRGPPRNYRHQHNNASWGNQEDEEHQRLCHIIKNNKDHIKHLEELLKARDAEIKKQAERVSKLETDNFQLTLALQREERESKIEMMVVRYKANKQTASNQTKKVLTQTVERPVQSEYQGNEARMEKTINKMGNDLLKLRREQHSLLQTMSEAQTALTNKDAALQQSEEAWQAKYDALNEKFTAAMEENTKRRETQENECKISLIEEQIQQRDADILRLTQDNNCLNQKLAETTQELTSRDAELLQSQTVWEEKFQSLKENFYKDLEVRQQSWETQQTQFRVKVETDIHQRDAEILHLTEDNNSLIQKLSKATEELSGKDAELLQCQTSWQEKHTALESISEDLAEKQQRWETEMAQLVADKVELEDLCLYVNKKRKRFLLFPRRSSDNRETQLQKLRSKKKQEDMEAAGCSAQAEQQ
ncbi:hypothetical protein ABVT39_011122 [Epinephelus coioides]